VTRDDNGNIKNIILVGFMAVGKSTIGQRVAQELDWTFLDTDYEIERQTGLRIPELFQKYGEGRFRTEENLEVKRLTEVSRTVISTGGGTVLDPENFRMLQKLGMMIHLYAPLEVVLQRVKNQQDRPMLNKCRVELEELWRTRLKVYKQAHITLDTTDGDIEQKVEEILSIVKGDYKNNATEN